MSATQVLQNARAALDEGLITAEDYSTVKDAFLRAQQIKAGLDAGFILESDYAHVKQAFMQSLQLQTAPDAAARLGSVPPMGTSEPGSNAILSSFEDQTAEHRDEPVTHPAAPTGQEPSSFPVSPQKAAVQEPAAAPPPPPPPSQSQPAASRTDILPTNIPSLGGARRPKQNGTSMSGIIVSDDAVNMYYYLKAKSTYRWAMWKINDTGKEVILCNVGERESPYEQLLEALPETDCRFAVYDHQFTNSDNCVFNKLVFISWAPDTARIKAKMMYASTKDYFKTYLDGLSIELQASEIEDITERVISDAVRAATTRS